MIIAYLVTLLGIPLFGYLIYLATDWMIKSFDSMAWIVAAVVWFIMCTIVGITMEHEQ